MAVWHNVTTHKTLMGRLSHGVDLLAELERICAQESVFLGRCEAIGAVQKACVSYYDQAQREYRRQTFPRHMEIASLIGNVSLRDGNPALHAHVVLTDEEGRACGGHLEPGTIVFACEFLLTALDGPDFVREYDPQTGLRLWRL
jgi:hypothetical protein